MLVPELGKYIESATGDLGGRNYEALAAAAILAPALFLTRFQSSIARQVVKGAAIGYTLQASSLKLPPAIPKAVRQGFAARAEEYAALLRRKALTQLATGLTRDGADAWLRAASNSAAWRGVDSGQRDAADVAGADFKTWVRAWARKERRAHSSLEGLTIPLEDLFLLPSGRFCYGPRDWDAVPDPAEWVYCGHALQYTYSPTAAQVDRTLLYSPVARGLRRVSRV